MGTRLFIEDHLIGILTGALPQIKGMTHKHLFQSINVLGWVGIRDEDLETQQGG